MLHTDLEFGPGTSAECKRAVEKLPPGAILMAYKNARFNCKTGDIVLYLSDQHPDIAGGTRAEFKKHLQQLYGRRAMEFGMWGQSAQSVAKLPEESDAMWLVIELKHADLPIMCVVYALDFQTEVAS